MDQNNVWELSLSGEALNAFKFDFDNILQQTLTTMLEKGSEEAAISMKITITLMDDVAPDYEGLAEDRAVKSPKFDHKIKSVLQIKTERSGFCGGDGYELAWNPELGKYTLVRIKSAQTSIFDAPTTEETEAIVPLEYDVDDNPPYED